MTSTDIYHSRHLIPSYGQLGPALRNWSMMPPMGGWPVSVLVNGTRYLVGGTPKQIAERVYELYAAHSMPVSLQTVWDFLNMTWLTRDPERAIIDFTPPITKPPEGQTSWTEVFEIASIEPFNKPFWDHVVQTVSTVSDPQRRSKFANSDFFEKLTKARIAMPDVNSLEDAEKFLTLIS